MSKNYWRSRHHGFKLPGNWLPMHLAPKDGSMIVLGNPHWRAFPIVSWGQVDPDENAGEEWGWVFCNAMLCEGPPQRELDIDELVSGARPDATRWARVEDAERFLTAPKRERT